MSSDDKQKIQSLIQSHRLHEALQKCAAYCKLHPDDAEAWFLQGSLLGQIGTLDAALDCLQYALDLHPEHTITHFNIGLVHMRMNNPEQACACFKSALALNPNSAEIKLELANALQNADRVKASIPYYVDVLDEVPTSATALINLSHAYIRSGQTDQAIDCCRRYLELQPDDPDAHFMLGNQLREAKRYDEAIAHYRKTLTLRDGTIEALCNMGEAYLLSDRADTAIDCFKQGLAIQPDSVELLLNLGNAYRKHEQDDLAQDSYRRALAVDGDNLDVLKNLAILLSENDGMKEAECLHLKTIELAPGDVASYINTATCYRIQRKINPAIKVLDRAISLNPDSPELHWEHALLLLAHGQLRHGWDEYEWRHQSDSLHMRGFPFRSWHGEDLVHKHILVTAEQGIGDEIMFASCLPDLIERAGRVTLECEPRLAPLLRRSFPGIDIQPALQTDPLAWMSDITCPDFHVSIGSLPHYFRNHKDEFPRHKRYLVADPKAVQYWRERYRALGSVFSIGISWKGGHISQAKRRSSSIHDWLPVLECPDACFINLQYGDTGEERRQIFSENGITLHHWPDADPLRNMDCFAAQISALDLVISIDNSTAHLAGALGVQTWVLQSYVADWRWMTPSTDSLWYPSVTQIYQHVPGRWDEAIEQAKRALMKRFFTL